MGQEVDLIKDRLSIAEVVGEYVQLKAAGQNLKGPCPFHSEKTPSFFVSPKRGTWHCFGACNEGGDIFTFIQKAEGVEFSDALRLLAEKAGVELKKGLGAQVSSNRRQRLFDVLAAAAGFYQAILSGTPRPADSAGAKAIQYLHERGVDDKTITTFAVGYAPNTWDLLQRALRKKGFSEDEMVAAGLIGRSQSGKLYDRFRGRIMFPIHDSRGRVVAFGGRIAPWVETGSEGKYINSPEGALYEKRSVVYNLHRAKQVLRSGMPCVVVEGYMDVVLLTQIGIQNVVATSGTAFTDGHVAQLARYTDTLHFAFDADAAGFKATIAATTAALAAGMKVATIVLPAGQDPADIAKASPDRTQAVFSEATPLLKVLLRQLQAQSDTKNREQTLQAILPLIRLVKNPIQQGNMIEHIAELLHLPAERVIDLVRQAPSVQPGPTGPEEAVISTTGRAEQELLGLLLDNIDVRQALFSYLEPALFLDQDCLALYKSMQQLASARNSFPAMHPDGMIGALPERQRAFAEGVRALALDQLATANQTALREGRDLVRLLRRRSLSTRMAALQNEVAGSTDQTRHHALERFRALAQELASIDNS